MPYELPYRPTPAIETLCIVIGELVGRIPPSAPLITNVRLHRELRISSIRSSLVIEGSQLSESQVTALLDGKRVLGPEEDILAAQNAKRAYDAIDTFDAMSEADLLRAHGIMMRGIIPDAGQLRAGNVGVFDGDNVIHIGALASAVPDVLANLFDWLNNTSLHPLVASCLFHCELELIHPFSDGNGRVGRLWQSVILATWHRELQWLPVESIILDRQQQYYDALAAAGQIGSDEPFVEFMLTAIRDALEPFAMDSSPNAEDIPDRADKGDRTHHAMRYFAAHEDATIADLANALGVSKRTAERVVSKLVADGLLVHEGPARGGRWVAVLDDGGTRLHLAAQ